MKGLPTSRHSRLLLKMFDCAGARDFDSSRLESYSQIRLGVCVRALRAPSGEPLEPDPGHAGVGKPMAHRSRMRLGRFSSPEKRLNNSGLRRKFNHT
jgi:hypothetical protein